MASSDSRPAGTRAAASRPRGPGLEFAVGAFLLLSLASLLVLAVASTNGKFGFSRDSYDLKARFTNLGQLRPMAPVKIGGVTIGQVSGITLDPVKFDSIVTLAIDNRYREIPIDTSAGILTGGLLGESYVGLQPGGDVEVLKPGEELVYTQPAVDLIQMVGKYMFGGGAGGDAAAGGGAADSGSAPPAGDAPAAGDEAATATVPSASPAAADAPASATPDSPSPTEPTP
ncbi:MAG TPA: outer membrane lipid asymmetry maintenance protein MlaD [Luteimonas sp.]|nr:outer membrane lipid asymmetry maintenance protein MlaD [Luteimonas sp.]